MPDLEFTYDGRAVFARPGDSIAAALVASDRPHEGRAFCGMGVCHDCVVTVDGAPGQRACLTPVSAGMRVETGRKTAPSAQAPAMALRAEALETELLVIGAGPSGLSAAITAASAGADTIVLDEREATGGQYFKPRSAGHRSRHPPDRQHKRGTALRRQAEASGARIICGQMVWFARRGEAGFEIRSLGQAQQLTIHAKAVILATGAYERPAVVPGWTLPGVMTIGAAQTFARRYGVAPEGRIVIAGHGPLGLQLAAELAALGANVTTLAERARPGLSPALLRAVATAPGLVADALGYWLCAKRAGVALRPGWEVSEILGDSRVAGVTLTELSSGRTQEVPTDLVIAGDGFAPQLELARLLDVPVAVDPVTGGLTPKREPDGTTPVKGVWIAGDAGGLGGAEMALAQGQLSASSALAALGRSPSQDLSKPKRQLQHAKRFQSALWTLFQAAPRSLPKKDAILCRCESVLFSAAKDAIAQGASAPAALKRATRVGMGRCQGRYCLPNALRLLAAAGHKTSPEALFAPQVPARPVTLGAIAREQAEWGGHRESALTQRPAVTNPAPLQKKAADLVIIGGGVTGISAALYAAREGASVLCLERGAVNGEASGGNAGSLHLQLLSWDFGGKAVGDSSLQLRTLPLQKEAIALWQRLEAELGADFEMAQTGGMMVAETAEQMRFLTDKVAAEARVGIQSDVIDSGHVRALMPSISEVVIGAAWCPGEGKINPLIATQSLARAARVAGAMIEENTPVTGLTHARNGYRVATPRGEIEAPRILVAAGGWSAQIARWLGAELPIRAAPLQMVVTEAAPPLVPCLLAHAGRHLTMKQAATGAVIIGGAWPATTGPGATVQVLPESLEGNLWVAAHTVPPVGRLQMIRSWAAMNIDIDGAPLLGPLPGLERVTVAATANGYTLGPLMGREAAATALSGRLRQDLEPFSMARFS